jgi:hypothetical protein
MNLQTQGFRFCRQTLRIVLYLGDFVYHVGKPFNIPNERAPGISPGVNAVNDGFCNIICALNGSKRRRRSVCSPERIFGGSDDRKFDYGLSLAQITMGVRLVKLANNGLS